MSMKSFAFVAAGLLWISPVQAQVKTAINVVLFAGNSAMPVYVAQDKGFFARENLTVNVRATPSSGYQMSNLIAGEFDIAGTAIDNLIAYMEGQGTAKVSKTPDLITIMGGSSTELALMAIPSIKTIAELKGKEFALDSLSTGFAFVLRRMLEKNGLQPSDYKFVAAGGTRERVAALREGKMAAALITEPFTTQMRNAGFSYLGEGLDSVGAYQASVQIANREWAKNNEQATVGYIKALLSSIDWLYDPANRDEAVKILAGRVKISEAAARPSIDALTKGRAALARKGELDIEGVKNVVALREQYGEPQKKLGAVEKYIELSYYQKAVGK
jgi:ABC-type nitrate/sulfonate/bicarbonate transport system substrate-binding protein